MTGFFGSLSAKIWLTVTPPQTLQLNLTFAAYSGYHQLAESSLDELSM